MRKKIVAGNWKMNLGFDEARQLMGELKVKLDYDQAERAVDDQATSPQIILFPPYVYLTRILDVFRHYQHVSVGAQNCHHEEKGAFTGEVSALMIRSVGGTHVIIGHSERRAQFGEEEALLAKKTAQAIDKGLNVVFCCGETLPEREKGAHFQVVEKQLKEGLLWLGPDKLSQVVIAYEPVWAIGTGVTASPGQAQEMHAHIRQLLFQTHGETHAQDMTILYGGSCNARNADELFSQPDVDGGLIGGASLKAQDFFDIYLSLGKNKPV